MTNDPEVKGDGGVCECGVAMRHHRLATVRAKCPHGDVWGRTAPPSPECSEGVEDAEVVAQLFHETYESLAPQFGYETRLESAVPWVQLPEANRELMVATVTQVLARLRTPPEGAREEAPAPQVDDGMSSPSEESSTERDASAGRAPRDSSADLAREGDGELPEHVACAWASVGDAAWLMAGEEGQHRPIDDDIQTVSMYLARLAARTEGRGEIGYVVVSWFSDEELSDTWLAEIHKTREEAEEHRRDHIARYPDDGYRYTVEPVGAAPAGVDALRDESATSLRDYLRQSLIGTAGVDLLNWLSGDYPNTDEEPAPHPEPLDDTLVTVSTRNGALTIATLPARWFREALTDAGTPEGGEADG